MIKYLQGVLLLPVISNMLILESDFGKGKVGLVHAMGIRGSGGRAPLILNRRTR